jgi:hypothetical protein
VPNRTLEAEPQQRPHGEPHDQGEQQSRSVRPSSGRGGLGYTPGPEIAMRNSARRRIGAALVYAGLCAWGPAPSALAEASCGAQPTPDPGCVVGVCVDGKWLQECPYDDMITCGPKPIPSLGCVVGRCVGGRWERICRDDYAINCGPKPDYPPVGCRVGECIDGVWQLICTEAMPPLPLD